MSLAIAVVSGTSAIAASEQTSLPTLDAIEVRSTAGASTLQALPTSVSIVDGDRLREHQLQINLSEGLSGVPGLQIKNRQNYAQDLQLSIRGYGARSTFGVRGVRLYVDNIPATMPDGQGSLGHIDIGSIERTEVLRGPYSALYGNSSGGIVSVFTETPEGAPFIESGVAVGSDGQKRLSVKAGGETAQGLSYLLSTSRFLTDGYRDHSAANRTVGNMKLSSAVGEDARWTLVANSMQSNAQDPQGLTWDEYLQDPRSVSANTLLYNTRKSLKQTQVGATYERKLNADHSMVLMAYAGHRSMEQYQAIAAATQNPANNPGHAGGMIDMSRNYMGLDARWIGQFTETPVPVTVAAGFALDRVQEDRKGYENFLGAPSSPTQYGVKGSLRRNEKNTITNADPYVQALWKVAPTWVLETGLRYSNVRFNVEDRFIGDGNPDDSGSSTHRKLLPVLGLSKELTPYQTVYGSVGRGFETPTLAEMSYTATGSGMNTSLKPSVSTQYELGYRQRLTGETTGIWSAAVFHSRTHDEIVTASNNGGRSTFKNAGKTQRYGAELQADIQFAKRWDVQAAYTYLNAEFKEGDNAGKRLPGLAKQSAWLALNYNPSPQWRLGVAVQHAGQVAVNDSNSESAPAFTIASASLGYTKDIGPWTLKAFARLDNLFDRQYVGSVIVNGTFNRYYESAPGRTWSTGLSARYHF